MYKPHKFLMNSGILQLCKNENEDTARPAMMPLKAGTVDERPPIIANYKISRVSRHVDTWNAKK